MTTCPPFGCAVLAKLASIVQLHDIFAAVREVLSIGAYGPSESDSSCHDE
jgi:hypothetical protein